MSTGSSPSPEPKRTEPADDRPLVPKATLPTADAVHGVERLADETAKEFVQIIKLMADETRVRILHYLMQQEEFNVRTLCELLGQSQPAVSHHLAKLLGAGIIECRRDGKHNYYHLVPKRVQALISLLFGTAETNVRKIRFEDCVLTYQRDEHLGA